MQFPCAAAKYTWNLPAKSLLAPEFQTGIALPHPFTTIYFSLNE